mgnify:CR=1 FL=1
MSKLIILDLVEGLLAKWTLVEALAVLFKAKIVHEVAAWHLMGVLVRQVVLFEANRAIVHFLLH